MAVIFGSVFSIIIHKLNLTSGVIPSMGMAIAPINFFSVQSWNALLKRFNINTLPFTPQVNVPQPGNLRECFVLVLRNGSIVPE